jgi:5-methylcytosine-specific restriction enzyme A
MSCWPYTTQRWQRLRLLKLQQNPLCELCLQVGEIEPATVVDHIAPINKGGDPFPGLDRLMSLCAPCPPNSATRCGWRFKRSSATSATRREMPVTAVAVAARELDPERRSRTSPGGTARPWPSLRPAIPGSGPDGTLRGHKRRKLRRLAVLYTIAKALEGRRQPSRPLPTWKMMVRNRKPDFGWPFILRGSLRSHLRMTDHRAALDDGTSVRHRLL